jgi:carbonic anhydrase
VRPRLILALILLVALPLAAQQSQPPPQPQPTPAAPPAAIDFWAALEKGNQQFVAGKLTYDKLKEEREQFRDAQVPPITVLACSDSRVPPELVFNQSLGALFVIRTAAAVADDFGIASIEFAISNGWTRLIVVLGHEHCGAVRAALGGSDPDTEALRALARRIRLAFAGIPFDPRDAKNLTRATEATTRASAAQLLADSRVIRDAVLTDRVKVVSAFYGMDGKVKKIE